MTHFCDYHLLRHQLRETCKIHVQGKEEGEGVEDKKEKGKKKKILFNSIRVI